MSKKLDRILVIDIETTCWEGDPPAGERPEVIEIGVCTLQIPAGRRVDRDGILVRPEESTVSPYCTEVTGLTADEVASGVTFAQACAKLRKRYSSQDRVWASYGDHDRRIFERQCRERSVDYPFGSTYMNVSNLFALMQGLDYEVELQGALEVLNLPVEGPLQRGVDGAWHVAAVLAHLINSD